MESGSTASSSPSNSRPSSIHFFDKSSRGTQARKTYLKVFISGTVLVTLMIFGILSIYWGALWKVPARNLEGWVVDFDGGFIGEATVHALTTTASQQGRITWIRQPASSFPGGLEDLAHSLREEHTWAAIAIPPDSSSRLQAALEAPTQTYDGSRAIIAYGVEARNENAFRTLIRPSIESALHSLSRQLAQEVSSQAAVNLSSTALQNLLRNTPQTLVAPVGFTIENLIPFDQPVATAATFVGMLLQLVLSFFIVMTALGAREASQYQHTLSTPRLILLRLASAFGAFFFVSLMYCLLNLAFQIDLNRKYGHGGFMVFWMVNFVGMLSTGLAIESMITLLTPKGIPFFLLLWVIVNLSVSIFPIEVLPVVYRYGYAVPFYNMSKALRTIVFGTKNHIDKTFGILIAWIVISCITLPLFQWFVRRKPTSEPKITTRSNEDELEDRPFREEKKHNVLNDVQADFQESRESEDKGRPRITSTPH
ncbi:hypothetical protein CC2G_007972 [Coprinopsis cinerea AmutBmut pab1-1]|nr:hypothetical protein CC2G_007972 [Coprinopsis cinerea AmutBmut pab1-1]